jgi:hypothetical protein
MIPDSFHLALIFTFKPERRLKSVFFDQTKKISDSILQETRRASKQSVPFLIP